MTNCDSRIILNDEGKEGTKMSELYDKIHRTIKTAVDRGGCAGANLLVLKDG